MLTTISSVLAFLGKFFPFINVLINKRERRIKAAITFREIFYKELQGLYPKPTNWPSGTGIEIRLRKSFPILQSAVVTFRPYIPKSKLSEFDEAWLWYRTATKREIDDQSYTHYMNFTTSSVSSFGGETHLKQNGKETFKRNVDRLLSFAPDT